MKYNKLLVLAAASIAFLASCNKNKDQVLLDKINAILKQDASKINTCYDAIQDIENNNIELNEHTLTNSNYEFVYDSRQKQFIIMEGDNIIKTSSGYKKNENTLDLFKSVMVYNTNSKYSQYLDKRASVPEEKLYITTGFDIGEHRDIPRIFYNNVSSIGRDVIIRTYSDYFQIYAPNDTIHHYEVATNVIIDDVKQYDSHAETSFINAAKGNMYFADGSSTDFFEATNSGDVKLEVADGATFNATINIDNPKAETGEGLRLNLVNAKTEEEIEDALSSENGCYNFIHLENDIECNDGLLIGYEGEGGNCIDLAGYKLTFNSSGEVYSAINLTGQQTLYIIDSQSILDDNSGIELNDCYINIQGSTEEKKAATLMVNGGKITQNITRNELSATVRCSGDSTEGNEDVINHSNFYMYGGKIESIMSGSATSASCISSYGAGANVKIVYGNFISDTCCVACDPKLGEPGTPTYLNGSTLTIDGGHFTSSKKVDGACIEYGVNATININGGDFTGATVLTMKDGKANIKGATFNATKQYRKENVGADGSAIYAYNSEDSELTIDIKDSNIYSKFAYVLTSSETAKGSIHFGEGTYSYFLGDGINKFGTKFSSTIDDINNFIRHSI